MIKDRHELPFRLRRSDEEYQMLADATQKAVARVRKEQERQSHIEDRARVQKDKILPCDVDTEKPSPEEW